MASNADELMSSCVELGVGCHVLSADDAASYIERVIGEFRPWKTSGHLAIGGESLSVPLGEYEFSYSQFLGDEPAYLFFDQDGPDRKRVVIVQNGIRLCEIMENAFGMEYFVSNKNAGYLLAVNWYVIEGAGLAKKWLSKLKGSESGSNQELN